MWADLTTSSTMNSFTSTDQTQAKLLVRDHDSEGSTVIPAEKWEFIDERAGRGEIVTQILSGLPLVEDGIPERSLDGVQGSGRPCTDRHPPGADGAW